jgi:hypothetical protein
MVMYKFALGILFLLMACSPTPTVMIGDCYVDAFADKVGPNDITFEVVKVIKINTTEIQYLYTFPNDPNFQGRWYTIQGSNKGLVTEDISTFTKRRRVKCPW